MIRSKFGIASDSMTGDTYAHPGRLFTPGIFVGAALACRGVIALLGNVGSAQAAEPVFPAMAGY